METKNFDVILADPPWAYRVWSKKGAGRSAENHYPTMSIEDICALPVANLANRDCALFLWATYPNLPAAFEVIKAWGFTYKTVAFTWVKTCRKSPGYFVSLGHWTRSNAEVCLLATKGHPKRISKSVRQLIVSPVEQHSKKPDETRDRIVELMGDLPRVELFARQKTPGWDAWGNEVESDIQLSIKRTE
ncbi:adenine methyltransferase [Ruminococcaceae bacterium OttesenSCG-928-L11]|nr:adenine methyltransferase [Ruminococcaceae bacterium OttesenSCG-928-L11]